MTGFDRRQFMIATVIGGSGLGIGWRMFTNALSTPDLVKPLAAGTTAPGIDAWIRISPDNTVTLTISRSEMGQGVETALAMLVAEELEADWNGIDTRWATSDPAFGNQHTAASSSVVQLWQPLREVAATARQMLIAAAAQLWNVPIGECRAERSEVIHPGSSRRVTFGSVASVAATLPVPRNVMLKKPSEFKIIGKKVKRLDSRKKIDGSAIFGWDIEVPNMLIAAVTRCPVKGGHVADYDASAAENIPGVHAIVPIADPYAPTSLFSSRRPFGVAVVAESYWSARRGQEVLEVSWDPGPNAAFDSASIASMLAQWAASEDAVTVVDRGSLADIESQSAREVSAVYEVPYLAHATMSTMCCTADVRADSCEVWAPTQSPDLAVRMVDKHTGLPRRSITVHKTYLGGGFGRRQRQDYVGEAVQISKTIGRPVKVLWSREEDMQHGFFRPMSHDAVTAWLDDAGFPIGWRHRVASTDNHVLSTGGVDAMPYDIRNKHVDRAVPSIESPVRVTTWRGVAHSQNAFVAESFIDELARVGGHDPYQYRRVLLRNSPRHRKVLDMVAARSQWGHSLPDGVYPGLAMEESGGSIAAQVVEVSVDRTGNVRVHRVTCVVDCGLAVNPDDVEAQIQGAIIDGLTATLHSEITIRNGRVQQSNFHDYPLLRINQIPEIEVHIVDNVSPEHIGGVGEVGLPPLAPAVANAVFAATGERIRKLPIRLSRT